MKRTRRSLLASLAGGAALLSGCSSGGQTDSQPPERGTPTAAFATPTDGERTDTPTETTPTATPDAVTQALTASRTDLSTALERLAAAEVVTDGQVGIVSSNAFAEYARAESPRPPIRRARETLDAVSDQATGRRQQAVNGLLFLCVLLEARADEHDAIVDGFSSHYQARQAFPASAPLETIGGAVASMRTLGERTGDAREALGRVEPRADALGVAGFGVEASRERQREFAAIAEEFEPAFAGTRSVIRAVAMASATAPAIERGAYEQAEGFAETITIAAENGHESLETALGRDVRHFRAAFERDRCLAAGMQRVGERYAASARAFRNDEPERGRERYRAAKAALEAAENECGIEL